MSILFKNTLFIGLCLVAPTWVNAAVKTYDLNIAEQTVNITGKPVKRITVNGQFPAPLLEFEQGDEAVIRVHNHLKGQDTSVHWHGLLLPGIMDGVPGFNGFKSIKPNQSFEYRFKLRQNGTYWYHAHSQGQEQDGLYGPLIVYPKDKKPLAPYEAVARDDVIMISDFHESSSENIMKNLKKTSDYYQNRRETLPDVMRQIKQYGLKNTWQDRKMWNQMRMQKTDLSDVTGYTYLVNGKTPQQNWYGLFKTGEKVRLRIINASAMSFFDVRIPGLKMTVVSADGQAVKPVTVDEFRIGTAETYDVLVEPTANNYQIQAEAIDRSGFALASLHNQAVETLPAVVIPKARARTLLTMDDMGGHSTMHHDMEGHSTMKHAAMTSHESMDMNHMQMSDASTDKAMPATSMMPSKSAAVAGWANADTPTGLTALNYKDLRALNPQSDTRLPSKEIVIHLGGNMERYIWTMNGKTYDQSQPFQVKYGERVRLTFVNDTMMAHPMHLHGMFVQLENGQALRDLPNKHTLVVPPGKTLSALLTADELGEWAIHCHLLYHMSAGMMGKLVVAQVDNQTSKAVVTEPTVPATTLGGHHAHH